VDLNFIVLNLSLVVIVVERAQLEGRDVEADAPLRISQPHSGLSAIAIFLKEILFDLSL
jgi:predicted SpoU family rRNA methylase